MLGIHQTLAEKRVTSPTYLLSARIMFTNSFCGTECILKNGYILFIYFSIIYFSFFWLRWVFVAARGLSLAAASGGYCSLRCAGFSMQWLLLLLSTGSRHEGFSSCDTQVR